MNMKQSNKLIYKPTLLKTSINNALEILFNIISTVVLKCDDFTSSDRHLSVRILSSENMLGQPRKLYTLTFATWCSLLKMVYSIYSSFISRLERFRLHYGLRVAQ